MRSLARSLAIALLSLAVTGGAAIAAAEDDRLENSGNLTMASEAEIEEAEAAMKAAEQELQDYLGGTVTRGIVLNEERGRRLRELRANVDAAKKRLDEAKSQ